MTETEVKISELQKNIAHLANVSEEGWILKWGNAPETSFELVCRKVNAMQVEKIDALISQAHEQAVAQLK